MGKVWYRRPFSGVPSVTTLSFRRPPSVTTFNFSVTTLSCTPRGSVRPQFDSPGQPTRFSGATNKVLACSHSRSLQLLCTVGGNQARLDARTEFEILEPLAKGGWKLVMHIAVS